MAVEFEKVKNIIVEKLGCEADLVKEGATFADLGADSLDSVELIMSLEEEFNVELSDEEAEKVKTVGDVTKLLDEKIS